jgi:hypothetical protein
MAQPLKRQFDAESRIPITNAAPASAAGQLVEFAQWQAALEANNWKDNVRVAAQVDTTIASPGAAINGIAMVGGDRVLLPFQTTQTQNGIYIWNGAATPMTRANDGSTFDEMESAIVMVDEGTSAGVRYRQTQVNGVIGTNILLFSADGAAPTATETVSGIAEIATQAETDAATDDARMVTPLKLKTSPYSRKSYVTPAAIGDGSATSIVVTHNLGVETGNAAVWEAGGSKRVVSCEVQVTSINSVTLLFDAAPTAASLICRILA